MLSEKRLMNLKKKLEKNDLLTQYDEIMKDQLNNGVLEKVTTKAIVGEVTYLPHRAVLRNDKKTTRVRIVFDASAKNKRQS